MVAAEFFDFFNKLKIGEHSGPLDCVDRLNSLYTVIVLLIMVLIVTVKQYIFKPISCFLTNPLVSATPMVEFIENFCWVEGTTPFHRKTPIPENELTWNAYKEKSGISYYQWIPFVLSLQAILFMLPSIIWRQRCFSCRGVNLHRLLSLADKAAQSESGKTADIISQLGGLIQDMFIRVCTNGLIGRPQCFKPVPSSCRFFQCLRMIVRGCLDDWLRFCQCLAGSYLFLKLTHILVCCSQLWIIFYLLGLDSQDRRESLYQYLLVGADWPESLWFPRLTLCRVPVNMFGTRDNYMVAQCVLPVNMLFEKIFIFLVIWMASTLVIDFLNFFLWARRLFCATRSQLILKKHLRLIGVFPDKEYYCYPVRATCRVEEDINYSQNALFHKARRNQFLDLYSSCDFTLLIHMLERNSGDRLVSELIRHLWLSLRDLSVYNRHLVKAHHKYYHIDSEPNSSGAVLEVTGPSSLGNSGGKQPPNNSSGDIAEANFNCILPLAVCKSTGSDEADNCHHHHTMDNTAAGGAASVDSSRHKAVDEPAPLQPIGFQALLPVSPHSGRLRKISLGAEPLSHSGHTTGLHFVYHQPSAPLS